jgi:hypothetical protein
MAMIRITKRTIEQLTGSIAMFIWRGHQLRAAFNNLILPAKKGGLGLMSPGLKTKTIFITNFLNHTSVNPFVSQYMSLQNPPHLPNFPQIPYIKTALLELSYIPLEHRQIPLRSKILFSFIEPL